MKNFILKHPYLSGIAAYLLLNAAIKAVLAKTEEKTVIIVVENGIEELKDPESKTE